MTTGTVVESLKGGYHVGDPIAFSEKLECVPKDPQGATGELVYLLLDDWPDEPVPVDVGDKWWFDPATDQTIRKMFAAQEGK